MIKLINVMKNKKVNNLKIEKITTVVIDANYIKNLVNDYNQKNKKNKKSEKFQKNMIK